MTNIQSPLVIKCNKKSYDKVITPCDTVSNMNIGSRIKKRRIDLGLSQPELAKKCGWESQSRISQYEVNKRIPRTPDMKKLANALNVTPEYLEYGTGHDPHKLDNNVAPAPDSRRLIPLISWVQAGIWSEIIDNFQPGDAEEYIQCSLNVNFNSFALTIKGDSMSSTLNEGDRIIVDPHRQPENGNIVIVRRDAEMEATVKRYKTDGDQAYLIPDNPQYPTQEITDEHYIIGVVVEKTTRLV